jgi:hypothetical protein
LLDEESGLTTKKDTGALGNWILVPVSPRKNRTPAIMMVRSRERLTSYFVFEEKGNPREREF